MKYSVFSVIMSSREIKVVAGEIARAGYEAVEWRIHEDYHLGPSELRKRTGELKSLCDDCGLDISCLSSYLPLSSIDEIECLVEAGSRLMCPSIRLASPKYDRRMDYSTLVDRTTEELHRILHLSEKTGVKILLEIHAGTMVPSASAAWRLGRLFDPKQFGFIFDPANMVVEGREDWKMAVEILGPYLAHVHAKNLAWFSSDREKGKKINWRWEYTPLENGMVEWMDVLKCLRVSGYDNYLSVEDLYGTNIDARGLVDEELVSSGPDMFASDEDRLKHDLGYLKSLEVS